MDNEFESLIDSAVFRKREKEEKQERQLREAKEKATASARTFEEFVKCTALPMMLKASEALKSKGFDADVRKIASIPTLVDDELITTLELLFKPHPNRPDDVAQLTMTYGHGSVDVKKRSARKFSETSLLLETFVSEDRLRDDMREFIQAAIDS